MRGTILSDQPNREHGRNGGMHVPGTGCPKNFTNNAKNISKDDLQRPDTSPHVKDDAIVHKFETVVPARVTSHDRYSTSHTQSLHSVKSLTRTASIETPLGVVRQRSLDSLSLHCGTSQENVWRELSGHDINSMPIPEEDDEIFNETSSEIWYDASSKTSDKSKIKRGKVKNSFSFAEEMVEISLDDKSDFTDEEIKTVKSKPKPIKRENDQGKFQNFTDCLKRLIPCIREKELDPERLLDVNSCSQDI